MESNNPQQETDKPKTTGKRFIVENRTRKFLRTDKPDKAQAKCSELRAAREPWFTLTDTQEGLKATYKLVNNNYQVTNSILK